VNRQEARNPKDKNDKKQKPLKNENREIEKKIVKILTI